MWTGWTRHCLICFVAALMQTAITTADAADAERRIALVVGISRYEHAEDLPNPRNDAHAIGTALRKLQFDVEEHTDLDRRNFLTVLKAFGARASQADVAVMYYSGHGIQVSGTNYLIPADAQLKRERDLLYEAVPIRLPLGELAQARQLGVLILDAGRNNPFLANLARGGVSRGPMRWGFATIEDPPANTLVALATRTDQLAEDGAEEHSPFAAALLRSLEVPGLELSLFFRRVRDDVVQATGGRQEPYLYGSLGANSFYFNLRPPNRPPVLGDMHPLEVLDNAQAEPMRIQPPTDPDGDELIVRVTGLPRGGSVRLGEHDVLIGDYLNTLQLAQVSFQPDGEFRGDAGGFAFTVMDERGGSTHGVLPITIKPSNRAPVTAASKTVHISPTLLHIDAPMDPDGDSLTITVTAVPEHGTVVNGTAPVRVGDRLGVEALTGLTFDPQRVPFGSAGTFSYVADDGRGGRATGSVAIEVAESSADPTGNSDEAVWQRVRTSMDAADYRAFLRLFGEDSHAPEARQRLEKLTVATIQEAAPIQPPNTAPFGSPAPAPPQTPGTAQASGGSGHTLMDTSQVVGAGRYEAISDTSVWSEPTMLAGRITPMSRGSSVQVLGRVSDADWLHVILDDGRQGYVFAPLLSLIAPADTPVTASAASEHSSLQPSRATVAAPPQATPMGTPDNLSPSHGESSAIRDCPACPLVVRLPPGSFLMGNAHGDGSERPVHKVTITKPFAMSVYPVTVAEWKACMEDGGCPDMPRMTKASDDTPVHNVHWQDAQAYVRWLARKTGRQYRLPSEAEWEYAARAGTTGPYWWAGQTGLFANCTDCGGPHAPLTPVAVGHYKPNPFGLHDMNGSVAQWVTDCWNKDYRGAPSDGSAWEQGTCGKRVLRGGSWRDSLTDITSTVRNFYDIDVRYINNGFRVVRDDH